MTRQTRFSSEKALAAYNIGLIQKGSGAKESAAATLASLVQNYPATSYALQALESLLSDGQDVPIMQQGAVYFGNRSNDKAMAAYRQYLALYPSGDNAGLARYRLAIVQQRLGNLEQAITAFDAVHTQYPDEAFARDAWLEVARSLSRLDRKLEAAGFYEKLAVWYPQSAEAEQALWEASLIYVHLGRPADAARLLGLLRQDFPASTNLRRTTFWEGKSLLMSGKPAEAANVLGLVAANRRFDYYSLRAQRVVTDSGNESQVWPKACIYHPGSAPETAQAERAEFLRWMESWAGSPTQPDIRGDVHLQRALQLQQMRFYDDAATEFSLARSNLSKDPWGLLAYRDYMQELDLPYQAMAAANRILGLSSSATLDAPRYLQRLLYPIEYGDVLLSMASEYGVDPLWMAALIRQESGFDRFAYSWAEARGLTQVIPSDGNRHRQPAGHSGFPAGRSVQAPDQPALWRLVSGARTQGDRRQYAPVRRRVQRRSGQCSSMGAQPEATGLATSSSRTSRSARRKPTCSFCMRITSCTRGCGERSNSVPSRCCMPPEVRQIAPSATTVLCTWRGT